MNNHNHDFPNRLTTGCPACTQAINIRDQAIAHLSEAFDLLTGLQNPDTPTTIRLSLSPLHLTDPTTIDLCHGWEITPKLAESIADAIDSMSAYLGSEPTDLDAIEIDENRMAQATARFMGWLQGQSDEAIESGEFSPAAVAQCNPDLYADVTDLFDSIDPQDYLTDVFSSPDPHESMNAYEQLVTGEWDGEL